MSDDATFSDHRRQTLLEWLTTTKDLRDPPTKTALAETLGVSARTLRDWQAADDFIHAWEKRARDIGGSPEKLQQILDALAEKAVDKTARDQVAAARAWGDMTGAIKPPQVNVASSKRGVRDLSDEDLDAMVSRAAAKLLDERAAAKR